MVTAVVPKRGIVAVLVGAAVSVHSPASVADTDAEVAKQMAAYVRDATANVPYVIVGSFKSYAGAMRHVTMLHERTGISVDLRKLAFKKGVLSLDGDDCERSGMLWRGAECLVPRGREYNGVALSIEKSDWYPPMKPGYYVVVAVTDADEGLAETRAILAPTGIKGYVTYVPTYQGCTH